MRARMGVRLQVALAVWLVSASAAHAAPFTLSLLPPDGVISGTPGSTIGWGYTLTNDSDSDWLMLTGLGADPFEHATADASLFTAPILAPGATITVAYDATAFTGLFQLTWDNTAPIGFTNSGHFVLSAEFWDGDPLDLTSSFVALALDQLVPYSAFVSTPIETPVPEPGTLLLTAAGAGLLLRRRLRRRPV
jgi:hypothetical protein